MNNKRTLILLMIISMVVLASCASLDRGFSFTGKHPSAEELGVEPKVCTDCHDPDEASIPFARFVHTPYFMDTHRQEAYQYEQVCSVCHQSSFCTECHGLRDELRPSVKDPTATGRRMQHRGDYLSRHRIDGRIDPTSCFRCHGNPKTAETCARCHG